jgi:hypothetical protein
VELFHAENARTFDLNVVPASSLIDAFVVQSSCPGEAKTNPRQTTTKVTKHTKEILWSLFMPKKMRDMRSELIPAPATPA